MERRMRFGPWRWLVTYIHACNILWTYGERAWPWNVRFVWSLAKKDVDKQFPRAIKEKG